MFALQIVSYGQVQVCDQEKKTSIVEGKLETKHYNTAIGFSSSDQYFL
jgi:hypothetical protein